MESFEGLRDCKAILNLSKVI